MEQDVFWALSLVFDGGLRFKCRETEGSRNCQIRSPWFIPLKTRESIFHGESALRKTGRTSGGRGVAETSPLNTLLRTLEVCCYLGGGDPESEQVQPKLFWFPSLLQFLPYPRWLTPNWDTDGTYIDVASGNQKVLPCRSFKNLIKSRYVVFPHGFYNLLERKRKRKKEHFFTLNLISES